MVASLACALAASIEQLIALRFAQAIGGCAGMVISRSVVRDSFDERDSAQMYSFLMLVMGLCEVAAVITFQTLAFRPLARAARG